jgi:NADPH2:quinone reductase
MFGADQTRGQAKRKGRLICRRKICEPDFRSFLMSIPSFNGPTGSTYIKNPSQKCLLAQPLCWCLVSNPQHTTVCLRFETKPRLDLEMKALYFEEHGELDVIQYGDVPDPEPGPGQVKMKVRATALNYLDIWVRRGWPGLKLEMPHWCGADMAGEIVELGKGVSDWQVGQRVVADPGINSLEDEFTRRGEDSVSPGYHVLGEHQRGGAAEYIVLPANGVAAMPDHVDFAEAAAPLLVTLTAWRMLNNRAGLRAGESVLVVGSGGGVNSMSIQVAKLAGAFVYAVAGNQKKAQLAKELGADVVLDRSQVDWGPEI